MDGMDVQYGMVWDGMDGVDGMDTLWIYVCIWGGGLCQ